MVIMPEGCLARVLYAVKREAAAAILIQKHVRRWLLKEAYMELYSAATVIQSNIRGFSIRQRFLHGKKHKAATFIQVNLIHRLFLCYNLQCESIQPGC